LLRIAEQKPDVFMQLSWTIKTGLWVKGGPHPDCDD
jgi:hypothetical protein